jgi:hypothetical protein
MEFILKMEHACRIGDDKIGLIDKVSMMASQVSPLYF